MQQIMQVLTSLQDSKASLADRRAAIAKLTGITSFFIYFIYIKKGFLLNFIIIRCARRGIFRRTTTFAHPRATIAATSIIILINNRK